MLKEPHGAYVTHADYETLEAETQRKIDILKSEIARVTDIAGDALGFSPYQRDQDTVEVLANHAKRLAEELAAVKFDLAATKLELAERMEVLQTANNALESNEVELTALRARCERMEGALMHIKGLYENPSLTDSSDLYQIAKQALEVPRG